MEFNLGDIKENTYKSTSISYTGNKTISSIEPSCYCMTVRYDKVAKKIFLKFKAGILDHNTIVKQGYQNINKYLLVKYKDGDTEKINVTGKIVK